MACIENKQETKLQKCDNTLLFRRQLQYDIRVYIKEDWFNYQSKIKMLNLMIEL